jgi:hypothetical protein
MAISPTTEGFRAAFRRPSLTLAEVMWRWTAGATALALFLFGLIEYLDTLPVTNGDLLFLRTKHPYLVSEAIAHILRGSGPRVIAASMLATLLLGSLWIAASSLGRIATVRAMLDYFRASVPHGTISSGVPLDTRHDVERDVARSVDTDAVRAASEVSSSMSGSERGPLRALFRLNFLRASVSLAALLGFVGASILAGMASSDANPRPGLAFLLFLPLWALICLAWWALNWILSLAAMFAVREGDDAIGAISAAVSFCRERTGPVFAVTIWTGLAHLVALIGATTVISMPVGFIAVVPWRLVFAVMLLLTLVYFALADWLYMARLAGYVCIAEMPEALLAPLPVRLPAPPSKGERLVPGPPVQTSIDRDETILSDVPDLPSRLALET